MAGEGVKYLGGGRYRVRSFTAPDVFYVVDLDAMSCTCPSFEHPCKHWRYVQDRFNEGDYVKTVVGTTVAPETVGVAGVGMATQRYQDFVPEMGEAVRVTLGRPRFKLAYDYDVVAELAPTAQIFKLKSDADFEYAYLAHLDRIGVERLRASFAEVSKRHGGLRLVFLCFEDVLAGQLCHRRMFARWWRDNTGEDVPELDPEDFGLVKPVEEGALF